METDFTLVPFGGLGNRIHAICSVIVYCRQRNKTLKILWFKDPGLNCSVNELMSIDPKLTNVRMYDAKFSDFILRDRPRKKNFYIPKLFQYFLFDRRIYEKEISEIVSISDFGNLDKYKHIFMVNYGKLWSSPEMWKAIVIAPQIQQQVTEVTKMFKGKRVVGVHIRRTDNVYSIKESPTELFIKKIQEEIDMHKGDVCFYLASDSFDVKKKAMSIFGNKIITSMKQVSRDTKEGIIDAFVEMNVLSQTDKIYASFGSSFSETAHFLSNNEFEILSTEKTIESNYKRFIV